MSDVQRKDEPTMDADEAAPDVVEIDGHRVPAAEADLYYHASGKPLTNEEWDAAKAARQADNDALVPAEFREGMGS